ncbi:MAG: Phage integrase family protein [Pedosphaera sp.]|nr:Phage integrase family protein [Pedosphaera sp.]
MKTKSILFRRNNVYYIEDTASGKQTSLRTKGETEAKSLLNARNEASRQSVLNLHIARAYLAASNPAFVERTWQTVIGPVLLRSGSEWKSFVLM